MLTHRQTTDNFTFVDLTSVEEADRATKELHGSRFFGNRLVVQPQRPKGARPQISGQGKHVSAKNMTPTKESLKKGSPKQQFPTKQRQSSKQKMSKGVAPAIAHPHGGPTRSQLPSTTNGSMSNPTIQSVQASVTDVPPSTTHAQSPTSTRSSRRRRRQ